MARKPSHYKVTVNRPFEAAGAQFNPGARYTIKASVYDAIRQAHAEAIASVDPVFAE